MLADIAEKYYLEGDYNCAESVLLAANEAYGLGIDPDTGARLMSAFGGGMGCGEVCGALAGGISALGYMTVDGRAHATKGFKNLCAGYVRRFDAALGGRGCAKIKPQLFSKETRCLETVRRAADVLEAQVEALRAGNA